MPSLLTLFLTYASQALIVFFYFNSVYRPKRPKAVSIAVVFLAYMSLMLIYRYVNNAEILNVILIVSTNVFLILVVYTSSFRSAVFHGVTLAILQYVTEIITAYLMGLTLKTSSTESVAQYFAIGSIISKLMYFFLSRLLAKMAQRENKSKSWGSWALLAIMPTSSMFVLLVIRNLTATEVLPSVNNLVYISATFFLLISNIIVYLIYEKAEKNTQRVIELELLNQKSAIDLKYLELLEQKNEGMRIIAHDFKKHLITMNSLSCSTEVSKYINDMLGEIIQNSSIANSKNKVLDVIIGKYTDLCAKSGIDFQVDIPSDNFDFLISKDLSAIFNNILDNAIESAIKSSEKKITLELTNTDDSFHKIVVVNSCDKAPIITNNSLVTLKKNKDAHGYGTKSIINTVKKYNGNVQWDYNETYREFTLTAIIPML